MIHCEPEGNHGNSDQNEESDEKEGLVATARATQVFDSDTLELRSERTSTRESVCLREPPHS